MIGGQAAASGPQTGGPARPGRAPARPVLPVHGPEPAGRQAGRQRRPDAERPARSAASAAVVFGRPLSTEEEIGERLTKTKALAIFSSDAISSSAYATEEILRVLLLAGASALFLSLEVVDRDHDPARGRLDLVPPGLPRLPERRRRLRRGQDQPGPDLRADRRRRPAHRLRHDGRGLDGGRDRPDPVGRPGRLRRPDRDRVRLDLADHDRQPARPARVGQHLRGPDLPVRRPRARRSSPSASSTSSAGRSSRSRPSRRRARPRTTSSRSASCSCSRRSPAARWR